ELICSEYNLEQDLSENNRSNDKDDSNNREFSFLFLELDKTEKRPDNPSCFFLLFNLHLEFLECSI
ncbi:11284_t:CDS:1, partial [Gigaspora margarita]